MKNNIQKKTAVLFAVVFLSISAAFAQTTEFNYQGSLKDNGAPANANYDFEFALFDALSGGNQVGSTIPKNTLLVANGVFAVKLDFGSVFPGANRYLEIRVKLSGQPNLTTLTPRQLVNSSPYSIKSLNADNATSATNATTATNATQLGGVAAGQYVITTDTRMSDTRMPTAGSPSYIQNQNGGAQATSNFNISGNGSLGGTLSANSVTTASIASPGSTLSIPGTNTDLLLISRPTTVSGGFFANSGVSTHSVDPSPSQPTTLSLGTFNAMKINLGGTGTAANVASDAITLGGNTRIAGTLSAVSGLGVLTHRIDTQSAFPLSIGGTNATEVDIQKPTVVSGLLTASTGINTTTLTATTSLGIGTTAPGAKLSVVSGPTEITGAAMSTTFRTTAGSLGTNAGDELSLASIGFMSANSSSLGIRAFRTAAGGNWQTTAIGFGMDVDQTARAGGATLWLHSNGNVGIGTATPTAKLQVVGDGVITGNLTVNGTINGTSPGGSNFMFGDGSDGDVTIAGATTLTRDMYYQNLTINADQNLNPHGFRIFVSGTLTMGNFAIIDRTGSPGLANGNGGGGLGILETDTLGLSADGGSANNPGLPETNSLGGSGGHGGGVSPGGAATAPFASGGGLGVFRSAIQALTGRSLDGVIVNGGAGGSGGANGAGGGGGGGGVIVVAARTIVLPSGLANIRANGGNGVGGSTGGGGGGGGVVVVITTSPKPVALTVSAGGGGSNVPGGFGANGFAAWLN